MDNLNWGNFVTEVWTEIVEIEVPVQIKTCKSQLSVRESLREEYGKQKPDEKLKMQWKCNHKLSLPAA